MERRDTQRIQQQLQRIQRHEILPPLQPTTFIMDAAQALALTNAITALTAAVNRIPAPPATPAASIDLHARAMTPSCRFPSHLTKFGMEPWISFPSF